MLKVAGQQRGNVESQVGSAAQAAGTRRAALRRPESGRANARTPLRAAWTWSAGLPATARRNPGAHESRGAAAWGLRAGYTNPAARQPGGCRAILRCNSVERTAARTNQPYEEPRRGLSIPRAVRPPRRRPTRFKLASRFRCATHKTPRSGDLVRASFHRLAASAKRAGACPHQHEMQSEMSFWCACAELPTRAPEIVAR
jgi:hypothetical protein